MLLSRLFRNSDTIEDKAPSLAGIDHCWLNWTRSRAPGTNRAIRTPAFRATLVKNGQSNLVVPIRDSDSKNFAICGEGRTALQRLAPSPLVFWDPLTNAP